jgi:hypothetical protein
MYFSAKLLTQAFNSFEKIEKNPEGKLRQEKVSGLSYLLATSELLKKHELNELNLAPSESSTRDEFKNSVIEFKELLGTNQYSTDLHRKFETNVGGSVSSNFLTTVVSQTKNLIEAKDYPSRANNSPLLSIKKENLSINKAYKENLNDYYNLQEIKTPLAIWLAKKINISTQKKLSDQINIFLEEKYTKNIFEVLKVTDQDLKNLGINESEKDDYLSTSLANLTHLTNQNNPLNEVESFRDLSSFAFKSVNRIGLNIEYDLIKRAFASTLTKRFLILTGLSGSGKTKLAEAMAYWLSKDAKKQVCMVAVGADWTNNEPLLGYADAINQGHYCAPASGILQLLDHAQATPTAPHFLILDEMNLSHVERYFADFLSAMESSKSELALHGKDTLKADGDLDVPARQALPPNVFIIGTVNVDETTYMFSPKVLDRANVIEFHVSAAQMNAFLAAPTKIVSVKDLSGEGAHYAKAFVARSQLDTNLEPAVASQLHQDLIELFQPLAEVGAEFGYRSAKEIARFFAIHSELSAEDWDYKEALDAQVMQKLMPKLHGSARKLSGVLETLKKFADKHQLPLTQDKINRMQKRLKDEGFTSFAEN